MKSFLKEISIVVGFLAIPVLLLTIGHFALAANNTGTSSLAVKSLSVADNNGSCFLSNTSGPRSSMACALDVPALDAGTARIGTGGSPITGVYRGSATITAPATNVCADTGVAVANVVGNSDCHVTGPNGPDANTTWSGFVADAGSVVIRTCCVANGGCTTSAISYEILCFNP